MLFEKKYYQKMNQLVGKFLPDHSSRIHIVSIDIYQYIALLNNKQWSEVAEFLLDGVHQLVKAGIDFLVICSNTGTYIYGISFVNKV